VPGEGDRPHANGRGGDLILMIAVLPHKSFTRRGLDLYLNLTITFTQALLGDKIMVPMLKDTTIAFPLPEYTQSGTTFKLQGHGLQHPKKNTKGDLLINVEIEIPKKLTKEQRQKITELQELIKPDQYTKAKVK